MRDNVTDILVVGDRPLADMPPRRDGLFVRIHVATTDTAERVRGLHPDVLIILDEIPEIFEMDLVPTKDRAHVIDHRYNE